MIEEHVPDIAYTLPTASRVSGFSRSRLYEEAAAGRLNFRKAGRRTLVLARELRALIENLPPAPIRQRAPANAT